MRRVTIGLGTCGVAAGGRKVRAAIERALPALGITADVRETGCIGLCYREVLVELEGTGSATCLYGPVPPEAARDLLRAHFVEERIVEELLVSRDGEPSREAAFLGPQHRVVLRNAGRVDPRSIDDYVRCGGFSGLRRALLELAPEDVIAEIERAGLRGRGGAGFPTGRKWRLARSAPGADKVVICNADEGDPGAFMDRNLIEADPFAVLEGMVVAAYAIGATLGIVYVREEYPLAVERMVAAVADARRRGLLGERILGSPLCFDVRVKRGAGAFVCGEETALIASLEGHRGTPRMRPPFPVERGYQGRPTSVNNVETFANVSFILARGEAAFRRHGTERSRGTKVFSLAGDVRRSGLVEIAMGATIRQVVMDIGGGSPTGRPIKAVQIGGPSGGCLPEHLFDTPIDYESLAATGAIMGSGGLVAMDAASCMVDVAAYFLAFTQVESCGKCTFCRVGTRRMREILDRIRTGGGREGDLPLLEELAEQVRAHSLCGLGRSAPNPVLTTLRYFRPEYEAHIRERRCPAGRCRDLVSYSIDEWMCDGCTRCLEQCVATAISRRPGLIPLVIDPSACARCGGCRSVCQFGAVVVR